MNCNSHETLKNKLKSTLENAPIGSWQEITDFLDTMSTKVRNKNNLTNDEYFEQLKNGVAFITFDYGIDGVSIEIEKYAICLEKLFENKTGNKVPLHFIGGDFHDKADTVLKPRWKRFKIPNSNGWSKWHKGKWFSKLFYQDMPEDSEISKSMAIEIWSQAVDFSYQLGNYLIENDINLLIPVNICTNPGNPSIALAVVLVSEILDLNVISSNHDFYWEGGKPARNADENPGPRDHFFRNYENKKFFNLFEKIFPWNGKKWFQVNINTPQSEHLIHKYNFPEDKVFEIGSCISTEFLKNHTKKDTFIARKKMSYILSNGYDKIFPISVKNHLLNLSEWMNNQRPIVCSNKDGIILDITTENTIYCLQPTRVIGRKRIYKDLILLKYLLNHHPLKKAFEKDPNKQLILHITGPVPIEHQKDLETILNAYADLCSSVPDDFADRVFIAFSVGTEDHPALKDANMEKLCIEEIYRLADIVLFPSETEGRGLPIIESGAAGIPIVCSHYYPGEVFEEVVGKHLSENEQIKYILFPEHDDYPPTMLDEISDILLNHTEREKFIAHNKKAVSKRYGIDMLVSKFNLFIERFNNI